MKLAVSLACVGLSLLWAESAASKPSETLGLTIEQAEPDIAEADRLRHKPAKSAPDTTWFVQWTFDNGGPCSNDGWTSLDNRIRNDGSVYWEVGDVLSGTGALSGSAAVLGLEDPCCVENGYDNDWYQAIRVEYSGSGALSFDYVLDAEDLFDFLQVEADSACASFERVDYVTLPRTGAARYRQLLFSDSGLNLEGRVEALAMPDFGTDDTHCLYVSFFSDGGFAPCDGLHPSTIGHALGVDHLELVGVDIPINEDFEGIVDSRISFLNIWDSEPFGDWARVFPHATDNDPCTENTTCSWIFTDYTTPTLALTPEMAYGPQGFVVRNWLENHIVSPWVSLPSSPDVVGTVIQFRRFAGQFFAQSLIVQKAIMRTRSNVATPPETVLCPSGFGDVTGNTIGGPSWTTITRDVSHSVPADAVEIEVRFRTSDWQWIVGQPPPATFNPGPGPYVDDVRIGRIQLTGPAISLGVDSRSQAQDAFATEIDPIVTPAGEHYRPTTDRFGTAAFSAGADIGMTSPNVITGDSIWVKVSDARGAGGIASVEWFGAIVSGPHTGKAPAPWNVDPNGFFRVLPDSARGTNGQIVADVWAVDLDDDYFRGGDVVEYFWFARDGLGGASSSPPGLSAEPSSIDEARTATNGLWEVSFLPVINWDPGYLGRVAADATGKLEPTLAELANSTQQKCMLYAQQTNVARRGGTMNRTTFMYSIDRVAGRDIYDVYDQQGLGNTSNHLGGRATVEQTTGYSLIIYDAGDREPDGNIIPDGLSLPEAKVDQAGWFRQWLAQAQTSEAGLATLWVVGTNVLEERPSNPLFQTQMSVALEASDQGSNPNPDVTGQAGFTFVSEAGTTNADFSSDEYNLIGNCPARSYDGLRAIGAAVETHVYAETVSGSVGDAAIVMHSNPVERWNTILQSHPWFDIQRPFGGAPTDPLPSNDMLLRILTVVLPTDCQNFDGSTDVGQTGPGLDVAPQRYALHQNSPNPFNPTTTIAFDLARHGHVKLRVFDVAGGHIRTLVDKELAPQGYEIVWDGLDEGGARVPSGVYVYRIDTVGFVASRKMLLLK